MAISLPVRLAGAVALAATVVAAVVLLRIDPSSARTQSTDDAYVEADTTRLATRVAGTIARVLVADHQAVRAGDLLVQIDERDLQVALESARAQVASAQAAVASLKAQLARQDSARRQAGAALVADDAALTQAAANRQRYAGMARDGSGTQQAAEQAETTWRVQQATRQRDDAALQGVNQQDAVLRADLQKAEALLAATTAAQRAAELNLSYARITAPVDGVVAQRTARAGAYVQPGQALLALVPLNAVYVTANFKETQLARMRAGRPVRMRFDALPGVELLGRVDSLAPASGVSFSTLPPHNATGNFTKIVQRLPVRIAINADQPGREQLRAGMSVQPVVDVASESSAPGLAPEAVGRDARPAGGAAAPLQATALRGDNRWR